LRLLFGETLAEAGVFEDVFLVVLREGGYDVVDGFDEGGLWGEGRKDAGGPVDGLWGEIECFGNSFNKFIPWFRVSIYDLVKH